MRLGGPLLAEDGRTTNGTLLSKYAGELASIGVRRINISLDTLKRDLFERIARREPFPWLTYRIRRSDGRGLWIAVSGKPVFDDKGGFQGYYGAGRDVTEREEVLVAFRDQSSTTWKFLDLKRGTGASWGGSATVVNDCTWPSPMPDAFCASAQ